jgi:hypothetical protein
VWDKNTRKYRTRAGLLTRIENITIGYLLVVLIVHKVHLAAGKLADKKPIIYLLFIVARGLAILVELCKYSYL